MLLIKITCKQLKFKLHGCKREKAVVEIKKKIKIAKKDIYIMLT
jgi:hypothetical protein